jgi:hypothetical protein
MHNRCEAVEGRKLHTRRAKAALGHKLPYDACIYRINKDQTNPDAQLVICPDKAYHDLLDRRLAAFNHTGNANHRQCWFCREWDAPTELITFDHKQHIHPECVIDYRNGHPPRCQIKGVKVL